MSAVVAHRRTQHADATLRRRALPDAQHQGVYKIAAPAITMPPSEPEHNGSSALRRRAQRRAGVRFQKHGIRMEHDDRRSHIPHAFPRLNLQAKP